ncbi:MAG: hypothetical protein AB7S92_10415 [Parvibaculaceae bacterium]
MGEASRQGHPGFGRPSLRAIYAEYLGRDGSVRALVDRLAQLGRRETGKVRLIEDEARGWKVQTAA